MTVSLAIVLATIFALLGIAKLVLAPAMRAGAAHLGYSTAQYRAIGLAELAGAIGALIGLAMRGIGVAAATGLVLLMLGAAREHFAHRDGVGRVAVPLIVAAMATAFLLSLL